MNGLSLVAGFCFLIMAGFGIYVVGMFVVEFIRMGRQPWPVPPPPAPLPLTEREDPDAPPYTYEAVASWLPSRIRADIETAVTTDRKARR